MGRLVDENEERVACVDLPAFPLQLVLRAHPDWGDDPTVVVEDDRPLARVLWANRPARLARIGPGLKFAHAESLTPRLRASQVAPSEIDHALTEIFVLLLSFSPHVEPAVDSPGLFWLDPNGLAYLYATREEWAERVHRALTARGYHASVVVGRERSHVLAIARAHTGPRVFDDPDLERHEAARVPLARMNVSRALHDEMETLGIRTVGAFLALPRAGLEVRYGKETAAFHGFLSGRAWTPLRPRSLPRSYRAEVVIDPPDDQHTRLLFGIKTALHDVLETLRARDEGASALLITLHLDHVPAHAERIETAAPTVDVVRLVDLVRLRLSNLVLAAPVERIEVEIENVPAPPSQSLLIGERPARDPRAAEAALARVRAAFGDEAVSRAVLEDSWIPEKSFRWMPLHRLALPRALTGDDALGLVRNVLTAPIPLPDIPKHETERWLGRFGAVVSMHGPARLRHGWWRNHVERDYYFLETRTRDVLWVYFDRANRGWYLQGLVD